MGGQKHAALKQPGTRPDHEISNRPGLIVKIEFMHLADFAVAGEYFIATQIFDTSQHFIISLNSNHYDDISLFVSFFDIPMRLGSLFQRIASINDRFYLARFNKLPKFLEEHPQL